MNIRIVAGDAKTLSALAAIPIAFRVDEVVDIDALVGSGGRRVESRRIAHPYEKDYDAYADNGPRDWARRFDLSGWAFLFAESDGRRVGGAVVAKDRTIELIGEREDTAVLWDLRVDPTYRRRGVGGTLLAAVERWAAERGVNRLLVETQDVNVPACRFYASHGFQLDGVTPRAYESLPDETRIIWRKEFALAALATLERSNPVGSI